MFSGRTSSLSLLRQINARCRRRLPRGIATTVLLLIAVGAPDGSAQQQLAATASAGQTTREEYEMLRRLLGVSPPTTLPDKPEENPVEKSPSRENPEVASDAIPKTAKPASQPRPIAAKKAPIARPAARPASRSAAQPKPAEKQQLAATAVKPRTPTSDTPLPGTVLTAADLERTKAVMGPSIQWALKRGAALTVVAPQAIPMETARALATERYHDRVEINAGRTDMKNYVAGIPFPSVGPSDPDAGLKVMLNQQSRIGVDDLDMRNIACESGRIVEGRGVVTEKRFVTGHWRRLSYVGRLYHDPKPTWSTLDGIRYRESQYPFVEPVDLKGGGWSYTRYLDAGRLDDVWLYNPAAGRVRRMSTAQRSQGMFGQDMDIDSLSGFSANPAWTQWRFLGMKTILAPMHASRLPVQWSKPPADFLFDEGWEPREVYVIVGRSRLPEYGSADRVVYVDRESDLVVYSEIYDLKGQLWRALVLSWSVGSTTWPEPGNVAAQETLLAGSTMIDLEVAHVTRCALAARDASGKSGWSSNSGTAAGVTPASFDVSNFGKSPR